MTLPPDAELLAHRIAHHLRDDLADVREELVPAVRELGPEEGATLALAGPPQPQLVFTFDERAALLRAAAVLESKLK